MDKIRTSAVEALLTVLTKMKTQDEVYAFLTDVCTVKEIQDMAQRLETARLLKAGKSYQAITEQVGASAATISRVNRCLNYGSGGYDLALKNLQKDEGE